MAQSETYQNLSKSPKVLSVFTKRVWLKLAFEDIRIRYRRTVIGPFWIVISMAIQIAGLALVFTNLFGVNIEIFLPYLACGLITWQFIAGVLNDSPNVFIEAHGLIETVNLPKLNYPLRLVARHMITFFHNLTILVFIELIYPQSIGWEILIIFPALIFLFMNGVFASLILGVVGTRYRDVQQMVSAATMLIFMMTPVFWDKKLLKGSQWIADYNPFNHFIQLFRQPALGDSIDSLTWYVVGGVTILLGTIGIKVYRKYHQRIGFWL